MRYTVKDKSQLQRGFTLIELAMSILLLGLFLIPVATYYSMYLEEQKREETEKATSSSLIALREFFNFNGYYPCPAPRTVSYNSPDYGRQAAADCSTGTPAGVTITGSPPVIIGNVPFRELNIQEQDAYDGQNHRLTYAVTQSMTSPATFDPAAAAVQIVDSSGNPAIEGAAHFIILTHGENGNGAVTREGTIGNPCPSTGTESENCDLDDAIFVSSLKLGDFDDKLQYVNSANIKQWQYAFGSNTDIHLKTASGLAVGIENEDEALAFTSGDSVGEILSKSTDGEIADFSIKVESGGVILNEICDSNDSNCFSPKLIAGQGNETISCPPGKFLVAIKNKQAVCEDEFEFKCPDGEFLSGIDSQGRLICGVEPPPACEETTYVDMCGEEQTLPERAHGSEEFVHSGQCYFDTVGESTVSQNAADIIAEALSNGETNDEIKNSLEDYVDEVNGEEREQRICAEEAPANAGTIRRRWQCGYGNNYGEWGGAPSQYWRQEIFDITNPKFPNNKPDIDNTTYSIDFDTSHNSAYNDCWCREDYRVKLYNCPLGQGGAKFYLQKYDCPQTGTHNSQWKTVYSKDNCECTDGPLTTAKPCYLHFGVSSQSVSGFAYITQNYECNESGISVPVGSPIDENVEDCKCPVKAASPIYSEVPCDPNAGDPETTNGLTNSFSFEEQDYENVAEITKEVWTCSGGTPPPQPATSGADAGYWVETVHTEECVCDNSLTKTEHVDCPEGQQGDGIDYIVQWDCGANQGAGGWEVESEWEIVSSDCSVCKWQQPETGGVMHEFSAGGREIGDLCTECGETNSCSTPFGNEHIHYIGCVCQP